MAKSKRKKRSRKPAPPQGTGSGRSADRGSSRTADTGPPQARNPKRPHKEQARRAREVARKRADQRARNRRIVSFAAVTAVGAAVIFLVFVPTGAGAVSQEALEAARAAGCSAVQTPAADAPGGQHLEQGQEFTYDQKPATSGQHDPSPLPDTPKVYDAPVPETQAVHSLEHAFVIVYYRQNPPNALKEDVQKRLEELVQARDFALMAPYEELPEGTALALTAWNKLWTCPPDISAQQASAVATGFMDAYGGTDNAPEPPGRLGL